jgi:hypothetical protein
MAKKVEDNAVKFGNGSGAKYDWDNWFDGGTWVLTRKEDFETEVDTFQTTCLIRARKRGITIATQKLGSNRLAVRKIADSRKAAK